MISRVRMQGMWNAQFSGQATETRRLNINNHEKVLQYIYSSAREMCIFSVIKVVYITQRSDTGLRIAQITLRLTVFQTVRSMYIAEIVMLA